jgi:uncharacterized protein YkwD
MKKYKNRKDAVKTVVAVLCAACMLTACGNAEADAMEEIAASVTETTTESAEVLPTEKPAAEPTEAPAKTVDEGSATEPVESVAVTAEPDTKPSAEPVAASAGAAAEAGYTCTEMTQTMYAKSAVNVRDLPSTDGKKIGSLKASQEITVTGKCDQTGWYRFDWNNTTGYVSDKYIVSEKPVSNVAATGNSNTAGNQYASNTVDDTFGITEEQIENFMKTHGDGATGNTTTTTSKDAYFDRAMAEQVFAMVNAERSAAGIPELTWSEDLYNIAMERCHEDDGHASVRPGTGENCQTGSFGDDNANATTIHQNWKNSQGHYDNYMNTMYGTGAVAILRIPCNLGGIQLGDGVVAYEVFGVGSTAANSSVTINTPVQDDSVAAAPKTADEYTSASSSNVGWSMTPPTQEDGLKKWQEQNPDVEVSFGN